LFYTLDLHSPHHWGGKEEKEEEEEEEEEEGGLITCTCLKLRATAAVSRKNA